MRIMKDLPRKNIVSRRGRKGFELAGACLNDTSSVVAFLRTRRSAEPAAIGAREPDEKQLALILEAATRVPDHGKMEPWRFIVVKGAARAAFAQEIKARWMALHPGETVDKRAQHDLVLRAGLTLVVVSRVIEHFKIPVWEQHLSAGASCLNIVSMATALGLAAQWRSGWLAEDAHVQRLLGLQANESIAGLIFIGGRDRKAPAAEDRRRPYWQELTSYWTPPG